MEFIDKARNVAADWVIKNNGKSVCPMDCMEQFEEGALWAKAELQAEIDELRGHLELVGNDWAKSKIEINELKEKLKQYENT